jgi:hypothetical protein
MPEKRLIQGPRPELAEPAVVVLEHLLATEAVGPK